MKSLHINFKLKENFLSKRIRKQKLSFNNSKNGTVFINSCKEFITNVHNFIMGKLLLGIKGWFQNHHELYNSFLCLAPHRFSDPHKFWQGKIDISASTLQSFFPKRIKALPGQLNKPLDRGESGDADNETKEEVL